MAEMSRENFPDALRGKIRERMMIILTQSVVEDVRILATIGI